MDAKLKHTARQVKELVLHPSWEYLEAFIHSIIVDKISTNTSKEVLVGMKTALQEAKKLVSQLLKEEN